MRNTCIYSGGAAGQRPRLHLQEKLSRSSGAAFCEACRKLQAPGFASNGLGIVWRSIFILTSGLPVCNRHLSVD